MVCFAQCVGWGANPNILIYAYMTMFGVRTPDLRITLRHIDSHIAHRSKRFLLQSSKVSI